MKYQEKAQDLVQKHTNASSKITARFADAIGWLPAACGDAASQSAIEAALITAKECKQAAINAAGVQWLQFDHWWDNVIAELEKMKSNQ